MNNKNKSILTVLLVLVIALVLVVAMIAYRALSGSAGAAALTVPAASGTAAGTASTASAGGASASVQAAPDFTVYDADGNEVHLSDYIGKPVVVNFWASWCPPCKGELPDFEKVYGELGDKVQFLMVDMTDGQRETVDTAKAYMKAQGYTLPTFYDTAQDAANVYGISSIPTTVFIDKDGNLVAGHQGQIDEATLRQGIDLIDG